MKARIVLVAALVVFMFVGVCYAKDVSGRIGIDAKAGVGIPTTGGEEAGIGVLGDISYGVNKYINVEVESGWQRVGWKSYADIDIFPVLGDIELRAAGLSDKFTPFVVVGAGMGFFNAEEKNGYSIKIDPGFAAKVGGGADYFITNNIALIAEADWYLVTGTLKASRTTASSTTSVTGSGYESYVFIGGGLKYYF